MVTMFARKDGLAYPIKLTEKPDIVTKYPVVKICCLDIGRLKASQLQVVVF